MVVRVRVMRSVRVVGGRVVRSVAFGVQRGLGSPRWLATWAAVMRRIREDDRVLVCVRLDVERESVGLTEARADYAARERGIVGWGSSAAGV